MTTRARPSTGRDFVGGVKERLSANDDNEQNVAVYIGDIQAN